ncbi:MAG: type II secretion system major pseudopilin GspG [SAR324 cluster bacterium]|nr:type II secretion system major pseudopilin GspG [SAR324 cluster bacterium]
MLYRKNPAKHFAARRKKKGFSFIEIMVVIIIIGLLATIVGVNLLPSVDEAKIKTSIANIRSLEASLDLYRLHNSSYPSTEQGLKALREKPEVGSIPERWNGPYLKNQLPKDGWDRDYKYSSDGQTYEIITFGSDGLEGGTDANADISSKEI